MGIVSCLGNDKPAVADALRHGRSGISLSEQFAAMGLRSHVCGSVSIDLGERIERKARRFMGDAAGYAFVAMQDAIADAGLEAEQVSNERTGLIAGSGGASSANIVWGADTLREKGVRRLGPYLVPRAMSSTVSACLAALIFAGGGEEEDWSLAMMFDAMGALSSGFNDAPEAASRPYDANRGGFVIAAGGGMLVLEELEHARARGARIYAELVGYGATSDGANMVAPSGEGAVRCMRQALATVDTPVEYVNTHGTSTPIGDIAELEAMREVFGSAVPSFSSSKSLCGHSLGAAGVQEAIHCLLMMDQGFVAGSANISELDPAAEDLPVLRASEDRPGLRTVMSNNFGFGGTNACLVFQSPEV
jgi:3-oxoacyl-[acyl-carrier-protein] synthase-1